MKRLFAFVTELSLRFRWVTVGLSLLLFVLGVVAFTQFNQELLPPIEFPQTFILIQSPGAEPEELVALLTIPIEDRMLRIKDVLNVESTTSSGFALLQISNQFGLDQEKLRDTVSADMNEVWLESGLARLWESVDPNALRTTADVTAGVIGEAWEKWSYIFDDLTTAQLFSLPAGAVEALPEAFLATLPETTQKALLGITTGERTAGETVDLPQSWMGISYTADLTPETVERILSVAPTMIDHFRNDQGELIESYIFAMSPEVVKALPPELTAEMSECSSQQVQALIAGTLSPDSPARLPSAWRNTPPEILTFGLSDLPLAFVSIGHETRSPADLRALVEDEIVPRLVAIEGVASAPVRGGQILPGEAGAEETLAADNPADDAAPESTPLPAQSFWRLIGQQVSQSLGQGIETYEDLTPEMTTVVLNLAGGFVENLNLPLITPELLQSRLLADLATEEAVEALPAGTLAWMPPAYLDALSDDLRAKADARVAAETRHASVGAAAQAAEEAGRLPVYFRLFSQMGEQFGLPLTLNGPADLSPEIVATLDALVPGGAGVELLRPLNAAAWEQVPVETLGWLPVDFVASLDEGARSAIETRAEAVGGVGALAAEAEQAGDLPPFFALLAQQPLLGGVRLCGPQDLSPELISGVSSFIPGVVSSLSPEALKRLTPEALAVLPADVVEGLSDDLRAELEVMAESAGGLGGAVAAAEAANGDSPKMPDSWNNPQLPKTAAEMVNSQYGGAAAFMNLLLQYNAAGAKQLFGDLGVEHIAYFIENEEGFLDTVDPAVLSLLSPDVQETLPDKYREIATNAFVPDDAVTRSNGNPSLLLTVYKDADANTVEAAHKMFDELDKVESEVDGLEVVVSFEQAGFIEESIDGVAREGLLGALFAIVVIFFFLHRSWRSTIVTAVSIPLSAMIAFAAMYWIAPAMHNVLAPLAENNGIWSVLIAFFPAEVTLNIMTLSGLTVAIGRVVDDSIVVLENIYRHIHDGDDPERAVREGTRDVSVAILASTVTTVIVFLPIGLTGGLVGTLFIPFGMAVSYALGASFIVAITIVPVLARWFVRREHMPQETETALERIYRPSLQWTLRGWNRGIVLLGAFLLFVAGVVLLLQRPRAFIPPLGEPQVSIVVSLPQGTGIIANNQMVLEMEKYVEELKAAGRAGDYQSIVGASVSLEALLGGAGIDQTAAEIDVAVAQGEDMDRLAQDVRAKAEEIFGVESVTVSAATISETGLGGLGLVLSGDPQVLKDINEDVLATLRGVEGVANLSTSLEQASQAGDSDAAILRVDQQSAVKYQGELETEDTLGVTALAKEAIIDMLEEKGLADEVTVSEGFASEVQTEGFAAIANALVIAVLIVYFVMVFTFRSVVHPFTILFTVPLAIVGVSFGMWVTNGVLGLPAMVGLLMLIGIVVTNGIVMIDRVQSNRKERGMDLYTALVEGATTRLRPVLMTAIAAIFALFPLAAQLMGPGGAIVSAALGTVVIGGLLTSTFFTLLVVPVVYNLLSTLEQKVLGAIRNR
ncbi:MAG: efflux RND transporter permease subunit [Anaerolineae bacterium]|nr:efflux RND transporter permease subunit [Anaerolineae bacterium]